MPNIKKFTFVTIIFKYPTKTVIYNIDFFIKSVKDEYFSKNPLISELGARYRDRDAFKIPIIIRIELS